MAIIFVDCMRGTNTLTCLKRLLIPLLALMATHVASAAVLAPQYSTSGVRINVDANRTVLSTLSAPGSSAPVTWSLSSGALPVGMSLTTAGAITGSSTVVGSYHFNASMNDAAGNTGSADFSLTVTPTTLAGTVQSFSFVAASTGLALPFTVYLPPGYATSSSRYPVIYHLHGIGGSHSGNQISSVPRSLESAVAQNLIGPCIVVFPDGFNDSFWADSANSAKPAETHLMQELLPYIDANYRTINSASFRVASGFSMGGFGAAKLATKFPAQFNNALVFDGALLSWTQVQQRHPTQTIEIFNSSQARFDAYSPWFWLNANAVTLTSSVRFRDSAAALVNENRAWRDALSVAGQIQVYNETGLQHSIGPILDAQGANAWEFLGQRFATAAVLFQSGFE